MSTKSKMPKDPHKPKSPQNLYFIFMNERRPILSKKNPNTKTVEITKLIASEWKTMSDVDKVKYKKEADKLRQEYESKLKEYKKSDHFKAHQQKISQWKANERDRQSFESSESNNNSSSEKQSNKQLIESEKRVSIPVWKCGQCTLHNLKRLPSCEVCDYPFNSPGNIEIKQREVIDLTKNKNENNAKNNKNIDRANNNNSIHDNKEEKKENSNDNTELAELTRLVSHNNEVNNINRDDNNIKKKIKSHLISDNEQKIKENDSNNGTEEHQLKKRFKCKYCDKIYQSQAARNNHSKYEHTQDPNYCGKPKLMSTNENNSKVSSLSSPSMTIDTCKNNNKMSQFPPMIFESGSTPMGPVGDNMNEMSKLSSLDSQVHIPPAKCTVENIDLITLTVPIAAYVLSMISNVRQLSGGMDLSNTENVPIYSKIIQQRLQHFNNNIETKIRENKYENLGAIRKDIDDEWVKMYDESPQNQAEQTMEVRDPDSDFMTFVADIEGQFYELWDEFEELLTKQGYLKPETLSTNDTDNKLSDEDELMDSNDNKQTKGSPEQGVKDWLTNVVGLPQYCDTFIANGFDDMSFIIGNINMEDLEVIRIEQIGHRRKILHFADSPDCKKRSRNKQNLEHVPPVILHSGIKKMAEIQKSDLEKFKQKFSDVATFTSEWKDNVTHFITPTTIQKDKRILSKRTAKYFQSVISGAWILCFDWVEQCLNKNMLIKENEYEVVADTKSNGCKLTKELRMRKQNDEGLFGDMICVIGDFKKNKLAEDVKSIVSVGEATILETFPYEWLNDIGKYKNGMNGKRMVFIYDKEHIEMNMKQVDFAVKFDVLCIGYKQLFDAISNYTSVIDFIAGVIKNDIDEEPPQKRRKM